jgi:hypothetical protein
MSKIGFAASCGIEVLPTCSIDMYGTPERAVSSSFFYLGEFVGPGRIVWRDGNGHLWFFVCTSTDHNSARFCSSSIFRISRSSVGASTLDAAPRISCCTLEYAKCRVPMQGIERHAVVILRRSASISTKIKFTIEVNNTSELLRDFIARIYPPYPASFAVTMSLTPPFTEETARAKVKKAQDLWNDQYAVSFPALSSLLTMVGTPK